MHGPPASYVVREHVPLCAESTLSPEQLPGQACFRQWPAWLAAMSLAPACDGCAFLYYGPEIAFLLLLVTGGMLAQCQVS